jgi:hypothetical protein
MKRQNSDKEYTKAWETHLKLSNTFLNYQDFISKYIKDERLKKYTKQERATMLNEIWKKNLFK